MVSIVGSELQKTANRCCAVSRCGASFRMRGLLLCFTVLVPVFGLSMTGRLNAQDQPEAAEDVEQRGLLRKIEDTRELLAGQKWLEATERFDEAWALACEGDDAMLDQRGADVRQLAPGQTDLMAGGKARLEDLYRSAPDAFRTEFSRQFDQVARQKILAAIETNDLESLRTLAARYQFAAAARQGLKVLARLYLDRGDFLEAALVLGRVQQMIGESEPTLILQTAWCYGKAGLLQDAADLLALCQTERISAVIAGNAATGTMLKELQQLLTSTAKPSAENSSNWLQPLGDYRRLKSQAAIPSRLRSAWNSSLLEVADVLYADQLNPLLKGFQDPFELLQERALRQNSTMIPVASPMISGSMVYVRTPIGVRAYQQETGELIWEIARPERPIKELLEMREALESGQDLMSIPGRPVGLLNADSALFDQMIRTNTSAQMSISNRTLFTVEESSGVTWSVSLGGLINGMGVERLPTNFIRAYDAESGLFRWEIGGQTQNADPTENRSANLLAGYYFLGAPLVLGSRVYVLAENGEGIFLVRIGEPVEGLRESNPWISASQLLTVPDRPLAAHPLRKHAGLIPSFAQGLLICPTCDDRIIAVSAEDLSIRWVFRYSGVVRRQEIGGDNNILFGANNPSDSNRVDRDNRWTDFLPRIVDGKVLVTPRDSDQLYCLDLATGAQIWTAARGGYHAVAGVTEDRVVLVGNSQVGAFDINTGKPLWMTQLRRGTTSGSVVFHGPVLQIPTDTPSIVTVETKTGRILVSQEWTGPRIPGNLIATPSGLLSQGLTTVTRIAAGDGDALPSEQAAELLVQGRATDARKLLEDRLQTVPSDSSARGMLIDILLDQLRADYQTHKDEAQRVRDLLAESAKDVEIAPLVHSLIGMTLSDAVVLGEQLRGTTRRQQDELTEIITRGEEADGEVPLKELQVRILRMLERLPAATTEIVRGPGLERTQADVLAGVIRRSVIQRTPEERQALEQGLTVATLSLASGISIPQDRQFFFSCLIRAGLPFTALNVLKELAASMETPGERLLLEQVLLESFRAAEPSSPAAAEQLLNLWKTGKADWAAYSWLQDLQTPAGPKNQLRRTTQNEGQRKAVQETAARAFPEFLKAPLSVWTGAPKVDVSDDRTMLPVRQFASAIPHRPIPLYGAPGLYRGWNLTWIHPSERVGAYDPDGRLQWTFRPVRSQYLVYGGYKPDSWAFSSGHLLIVHLQGTIYALDGSAIGKDGSPAVLWQKSLEVPGSSDAESTDTEPRDFVAPEDRIENFSHMPGGHFPVGPVTAFGVPLIQGRRLLMLHSLTGRRLWEVDGIPRDARLLTDGDTLLVISESARKVDVRSQIDGDLQTTARLPEWWGEAGINVGSSVEDIDVEPGTDILWRVLAEGRRCVLFRLTAGQSFLESRDLLTDEPVWSLPLPQKTVFSNVVEDVVAVLSEGKQLKLVYADSGEVLSDLSVQQIPEPRKLYLQASQGQFLVLPEALSEEDPSLDFFNPIIDAVHVHGAIYAVNRETKALAWELPVTHRQVRLLTCTQTRPLLPNLPLLVLLSRDRDPKSQKFSVVIGAQVVDVRNGKLLYEDGNTGLTQNELWLSSDAENRQLCLSFDRRFVTFSYGVDKIPPAP
ncbi:MAG: PQQ-binding-like beta-propeller repeat protein [Planctomycetia bacterium]